MCSLTFMYAFQSAGGGFRRKNETPNKVLPKVVIMGSSSVSVESVTNFNNTSTDSGNTVITMVTVTDSGETDSFDHPAEDTMRITTNLLEDMLGNTPGSSLEKDDEFYSASSTEEQSKNDEVKLIFHGVEEEDDSNMILLQHTKIPTKDTRTIVEDTSLPPVGSSDPAVEWYNIKIRQASLPQNKNTLSTNKRLKLLSKRYAKNNFEDEGRGRKHGRNSSGFAAEQMTIESEEDPTAVTASPPIPDSPTGIIPIYEPAKSPPPKTETIFCFPDIHEEGEKEKEKLSSCSKKLKTEKDASNDSSRRAPTPEPQVRMNTATIVVQQASVTGNSPEAMEVEDKKPTRRKEDEFKQLLDVTNNITIQQMHESGIRSVNTSLA